MTAVLPHLISPIVRKDGVAEQSMRAWMQTVNDYGMLEGSGSPEGVIEASQKRFYFNTTGSVGTLLYFKSTQGGKTGWVAIG